MKKHAEKVDLKELNGKKASITNDILLILLGAALLMICVLAIYGGSLNNTVSDLNAQVQNLTNETAKLTGWAQYFSPAAIQAINDLASNQQNMTGRIITLELKNGITPIELLQNKTK
jgi:predicted PurR-regulated permease PerM